MVKLYSKWVYLKAKFRQMAQEKLAEGKIKRVKTLLIASKYCQQKIQEFNDQ